MGGSKRYLKKVTRDKLQGQSRAKNVNFLIKGQLDSLKDLDKRVKTSNKKCILERQL